ncbi:MAG: type I-D CRISPR-associated protein Cas5/Csc1 [Tepidibacter sp.]|jgi:CRISPR-associated protein Csc1|uniref:type I-D CRISPR-associated protein Cas5/Csc1 n=1 Tax=Tepidibacter sp. TaxID=2529387 RepID=UPI0025FBBC48|nr:type I-D CRISPR-associated protein Cas5/Csc1 [Tepidibacter sp.]MCT4509901.1 type I-D CRISPR-associated protein Cas5/Csc1 [Tepidibacter sp.]
MEIYKYTLEFKEEVYFSSQEIDIFFSTKPIIGNYALAYAMNWCNSKYNQNYVSYEDDFKMVNHKGLYIIPAIIKNPKYNIFTFNGLSHSYYHKMQRAQSNYPQMGKIKALSTGNIAEGFIFAKGEFRKLSYIRLGKFMGKVKVIYEKCDYKVIEEEKECYGLVNSLDLHDDFEIKNFDLINVHPVSLFKNLKGRGKMYEIKTKEGTVFYPCNIVFGGSL